MRMFHNKLFATNFVCQLWLQKNNLLICKPVWPKWRNWSSRLGLRSQLRQSWLSGGRYRFPVARSACRCLEAKWCWSKVTFGAGTTSLAPAAMWFWSTITSCWTKKNSTAQDAQGWSNFLASSELKIGQNAFIFKKLKNWMRNNFSKPLAILPAYNTKKRNYLNCCRCKKYIG